MNIQNSIKLLSAAVLMSAVWGCSSSKQVAKSSSSEVYDDMYASADESRPASLTSREKYYNAQNEEDYTTRNPEYRGQTNKNTQGTDEYYSQNWINSRQYYQNQVPFSNNGWNNSWNNGFNGGWNSPFNNYGWNNWGRPGISLNLGFGNAWGNPWNSWNDPWNSYAFGGGGFNSWGYDPWGWGGSRWGFGNGFNTGWNSWGNPYGGFGNNFYDPWGGWGGRQNTIIVNNYGTGVTGANGNYSNPNTTRPARVRDTYSSSAYNGDYNSNRSGTVTRQNRTDNTSSSGDYYSRPSRNNNYSNGSGNTTTQTNSNANSNSSNRSNSSWNWSNGNSNSGNTTTNSGSRTSSGSSSWGGSSGSSSGGSSGSSGGSSSGSSGGSSSGGGGGSRGPR